MNNPTALNTSAQLAAAAVFAQYLIDQGITDYDQLSAAAFAEMAHLTAEGRTFDKVPEGGKAKVAKPLHNIRPRISELGDRKLRAWTRFTYDGLLALKDALHIPDVFKTSQADEFSGIEALAILCNRLVYPSRLDDLADRWGRDRAQISRVVNELCFAIHEEWSFLLTDMSRYSTFELERFASAITTAGCPMTDIAFFLDSTFQMVARPSDDQRIMFTGYKKGHGYKYQGVVSPDGLIALCHGPIEGSRADGKLFEVSGLPEDLVKFCRGWGGRQLFVYADPAYGELDAVLSGLRKVESLTKAEQEFNALMAKLRQSVEWAFGKLENLWAFLNYPKDLKIHLSPVIIYFRVAVLLTNAHTCLYGSEVSRYFDCAPPTLQSYFTHARD